MAGDLGEGHDLAALEQREQPADERLDALVAQAAAPEGRGAEGPAGHDAPVEHPPAHQLAPEGHERRSGDQGAVEVEEGDPVEGGHGLPGRGRGRGRLHDAQDRPPR